MHVPYEIDATAAIKELGIRIPVRFEAKSLNVMVDQLTGQKFFDPLVAAQTDGTLVFGRANLDHLPRYAVVEIDWEAFLVQRMLEPGRCMMPEETIAHELVHVRQQQDCKSGKEADAEYNLAGGSITDDYAGYMKNPLEEEAFRLAPELSNLIKLTPKGQQ